MRFRPPKPISVTLNLAPMVDVMMCLIIFFLLAAKLVSAQHRPLRLPYAQKADVKERQELGSRTVINVQRSPSDALAAEYAVQVFDGQRIGERILRVDEVADYLAARAEQTRKQGDEPRCLIRADKEAAYGHVEVVLRACGLAKIEKVVFSANSGVDPEEPR